MCRKKRKTLCVKKNITKIQAEKERFFDSESSLGELFSKTDDLVRESLSPAAGPLPSTRKETPLTEQIILLKQVLVLKEEQLSHYKRKLLHGKVPVPKTKKLLQHVLMPQGKNPVYLLVIWKGMWVDQFLRVCIMEISYFLQNLIHLVWTDKLHHFAVLIRLFILESYWRKLQIA